MFLVETIKKNPETSENPENKDGINFNWKYCKLEVTTNMQFIEVINQIEKELNISFREYELFTKYRFLSEDNDNELLGKLFRHISEDKPKELYIYPKSELYKITIASSLFDRIDLLIHDSMFISTIIEMVKEKFNANNKKEYYLSVDGEIAYKRFKALFYNLRKCNYIYFENLILYG